MSAFWNRSPRARGFTLLEILIAFTIMAVALVALLQAFSTGLASTEAAGARTRLVERAQSRLADVGAAIPLAPGVVTGYDGDHEWRVDIRSTDAAAESEPRPQGPRLLWVEVTVTAPDGRQQSLTTLRLAGPP